MKSLVAVARNAVRPAEPKTPVAYARKSDRLSLPLFSRSDAEAQMRTYQSVPAVHACASELAEATAQVEWHLWREHPSGRVEDRTEVTEATGGHAALDLWEEPNPFMDRSFFVELVQLYLDLAGEAFIVIGSDDRAPSLPLSLWPVRPDMMTPVPDPKKYLAGYDYCDPDGMRVPFPKEQVIHLRYPNPLNIYRGMSPVLALLTDLDAARYSTEWTRNFFANSAEPGGVIEIRDDLQDEEFDEFAARWDEQHKGTANAHRIAILLAGMKWVQRSYSMRDLQFTELQKAADERIALGFKMGKTLLGQTEGVNRATAEAAEYVFGKYRVVRRLNRFRRMLNRRILPLYEAGADEVMRRRSVERPVRFDYESPVTANIEEEARERDSQVNLFKELVVAGAEPSEAAEAAGLPEVGFREPQPAPMPVLDAPGFEVPPDDQRLAAHVGRTVLTQPHDHHHHPLPVLPRAQGEFDLDPADLPDISELDRSHQRILQNLVAQWEGIEGAQKAQIQQAVLAIAQGGSIEDLVNLINAVDLAPATDALDEAMEVAAREAGEAMAAEAAAQGVSLEPQAASAVTRRGAAALIAHNLASRLAASASKEAIRVNSDDATPEEVASAVGLHLQGLSKLTPKGDLSGALTGSQNEARIATLKAGPAGAVYANETLDGNTCFPAGTMVTARRGAVDVADVGFGDELLTHAGRWVRPSAIVGSEVEEQLASVHLSSGATLRATLDHPVMVWRSSGLAWCPAGKLAAGDLVVSYSLPQVGEEVGGVDLALGEDRAVHGPSLAAARDLGATLLAGRRRVAWAAVAPPLEGTTSLAAGCATGDIDPTVNTITSLSRHRLSLLTVGSVSLESHRGLVYDFTIPGDGTFFADGVLVHNCGPCRSIDGKWLGNTDDMDSVTALYPGGGYGGYVDCEGRERCRGTITGVWRRGIGDVPPQPVAQPEPAPEPAPAFAEPTPPPPDPVTADRARRADALRAVIAAEDRAVERINRSGAQGLTEIVVLGDGRRVVAKQLRDPYGRVTADQRIEADAEELVNRVAVAVGVDAPVLERTGRTELRLEFVDAPLADELPHSERERLWTSTDSGRLVGLLDLVTGNTDRHAGNWFADGDRVIPIDHGYTFNPGDELLGEVFEATSSVFADHFAEWGPSGQVIRASNDMSPDDMAVIGDRLRGLRPEFERLGHRDWHDYMMSTFDEAAGAASGDRSRLGL